jgi:hypothetical protein
VIREHEFGGWLAAIGTHQHEGPVRSERRSEPLDESRRVACVFDNVDADDELARLNRHVLEITGLRIHPGVSRMRHTLMRRIEAAKDRIRPQLSQREEQRSVSATDIEHRCGRCALCGNPSRVRTLTRRFAWSAGPMIVQPVPRREEGRLSCSRTPREPAAPATPLVERLVHDTEVAENRSIVARIRQRIPHARAADWTRSHELA